MIYLDISKDDEYDIRRNDQNYPNRNSFFDIIKDVSKVTFMPITIGGKINSIKDIEKRLSIGADKISINTKAVRDPQFIYDSALEFGSQCIVVSIDVKLHMDNYFVFDNNKSAITDLPASEFVKQAENMGAGEILLNSVDRDGLGNGYDLNMINEVAVKIPVISCGGGYEWSHFYDALSSTNVDAVAAANIFHYRDQSVFLAKKYLYEKMSVRKPDLLTIG